ncbi:MAG: hypothetical protein AB1603_00425 [Chloroflexota bacterium]
MIYWAPLLHFYQPPTQLHWVLRKVCDESYRPLLKVLQQRSHAEVTVNINAVLTEMLAEHGMSDVIAGLRGLAETGRLEFTGSAKYHAILPLTSQQEMLRQIVHNHQANRRFFGEVYSPQGFFPPEMCYGRNILKPVMDTGHRWLILSGVACPTAWPTDVIYQVSSNGQGLAVFFRDDILSNRISFRQTDARGFIDQIRSLVHNNGRGRNSYVVTAMDAETFGHHIRNWEELFLSEVYQALNPEAPAEDPWVYRSDLQGEGNGARSTPRPGTMVQEHGEMLRTVELAETVDIRVVTLSKLLRLIPSGQPVEPRPSSWSTSLEDIYADNPYPLWKSRDNPIHQLQWQHMKIATEMTIKAEEAAITDPAKGYADIARALLDRAMHSDQFWWASKRPWWDVNLVYRGLMEQSEVVFNAYKAIKLSNLSEDEKMEYHYRVVASNDLRNKIMDHLLTG